MSRQAKKVIINESTGRRIIEQSRLRLVFVGAFFTLCYVSIGVRMLDVAVINNPHAPVIEVADLENGEASEKVELPKEQAQGVVLARGDIVDRNGELIATSLMTSSVFVNPKEMKNKEEAAAKLSKALGMDKAQLLERLKGGKSFLWIKRNLTPREEQVVNALGIPGLYFLPEEKRVYPHGNAFSHVVGYVGVDNKGLAGIEKQFDERLRDEAMNNQPLALALDVRLQAILREEMLAAVDQFSAIGATGMIMDVRTGEILSMVSLPDFDPHKPTASKETTRFNRATLGTYEMGSTFKTFTMAVAMENGVANMKSSYDASNALKIANFTIQDSHPMHRWLTVPEIYAYSSNVGTARVVLDVGKAKQKAFLEKLGMMKPIEIELPEKSSPLYPKDWKDINSVTISYGHGISVSPLHLMRGIASMVNGGTLPRMTLLKDGNKGKAEGARVISEKTSANMRRLMRLVVNHGTGTKADVPGYRVAGKTGTAEKVSGKGYDGNAKLASFIGTFPVDDPQYVVLVMIDEPKGDKTTHNFATGGWISAPVVNKVIARMGPLLNIRPVYDAPKDDAEKFWVENNPSKAPVRPTGAPSLAQRYLHAVSF
ncbi:MAG: penicillin-binding protein 2 [Proteobacteria bacterium]|nr:penicillin-binding protein 2 [Pseudomonadota bacterium]